LILAGARVGLAIARIAVDCLLCVYSLGLKSRLAVARHAAKEAWKRRFDFIAIEDEARRGIGFV